MGKMLRAALVITLSVATISCSDDDSAKSSSTTTTLHPASTTEASSPSTSPLPSTTQTPTTSAAPSVADLIARSTGLPSAVQTVPDVGKFPYHVISAFGSIWVLAKHSATVTRIDAITGDVDAIIPLGIDAGGTLNRLAAGSDAVYASARPLIRIDPTDNHTTAVDDGIASAAVIASGTTVWTAGLQQHLIRRIDADDNLTVVDAPEYGWMDLAISHGLVWALNQTHDASHLIAFETGTGLLVHDITLPLARGDYPVRLVADELTVAIGVDSTASDGADGALLLIDPTTGSITATMSLPTRPEGIALSEHHIWTSGAVIDRATLTVTDVPLGFSVAQGPDGSIWATSGSGLLTRFAPGDFTD